MSVLLLGQVRRASFVATSVTLQSLKVAVLQAYPHAHMPFSITYIFHSSLSFMHTHALSLSHTQTHKRFLLLSLSLSLSACVRVKVFERILLIVQLMTFQTNVSSNNEQNWSNTILRGHRNCSSREKVCACVCVCCVHDMERARGRERERERERERILYIYQHICYIYI
jgi:hypothetical protein